MNISISLQLSPRASELIRKFGAPMELCQQLAATLDNANEDSLNEIRSRLNVQGAGKHRRGSKRGIAESETGNYEFPHKVSSRLQRSMGKTNALIDGDGKAFAIHSTVGSGVGSGAEAVRYAHLQEFGGTVNVPSRGRRSSNPKYLKAHPGPTKAYSFTVRARSFLRRTINERKQIYSNRLSRTVKSFYGVGN